MINLSAMAFRMLAAFILATLAAAVQSRAAEPTPPPPDPCGQARTDLLAAIDRPTVGFSPCAVKPKDVLAEFGYANQTGSGDPVPFYPQGLIRFGVAPNLEADLIAPSGHFDSGIGMKYEFSHTAAMAQAVDLLYTAPNGSPERTNGTAVETVNYDVGVSFPQNWSGGITLGYQMGSTTALLPSAAVVKQFSPKLQVYVEGYGATRTRPGAGWRVGYDGGIQRLLSESVELDVEAGHTTTDLDHSNYVGLGFGVRL